MGGVGAWETAMMWGNRKRRPECMPVPSPMEDTGSPPGQREPREELTTRPRPLGRDGGLFYSSDCGCGKEKLK